MRHLIKIIVFISIAFTSFGQSYSVTGKVQDDKKAPLIAATIIALNPVDSTMVGFSITDGNGEFEIKSLSVGKYTLQITYIGFGTFERPFDIVSDTKKLDMGEINLTANSNALDEVIVKGEFIPLVIKKDTVEYNADAFRVRPNANVEELLKQLPGVEVDSDGTITAQGEEVKNITVDGKKFFGNDPKMATKNIPADAIKKVQVFDQKSDKAEFSGVNDGNETKTINLELKDGKKVGMFGNIEAGYGTDARYKSKFSLNKFGAKYQAAGLISYNNINDQGFTFSEYQTLTGSQGGFGRRSNVNGPVNWGGLANGNTTSLTSGLNLSLTPSKKFEITSSYFLTLVDKASIDQNSTEYTLATRNFFEETNSYNDSYSIGHNVNVEIEAKPDSTSRLDVDLNYKRNDFNNTFNQFLENRSNTDIVTFDSQQNYSTDASNDDLTAEIEYNKRLGKIGRILTLEGTYGLAVDNDSSYVDQYNIGYQLNNQFVEEVVQDQLSRQDNNTYQVKLNYKEPLGKDNYLDFFVERKNINSDKLKDFLDYDLENTSIRTFNDTLSTLTNNDITYSRVGMEYTIDKEKFTLGFKGTFNHSELDGAIIGESNISNSYDYFLPEVSFRVNEPNIRINYRTRVNEPSTNQLQSIVDNTDPTRVYTGNPDLRPEYSHEISGRYFFFDRFNLNSMFTSFSYTYTQDKIVNAQNFIGNNISQTRPINTDNQQRYRATISYNTPIRPLKIKTGIRLNANLSKGINIIDGIEDNVTTTSPSVRLSVENTNNKVVSLRLGSDITYNRNQYEINDRQNIDFLVQNYDANLLVTLPKAWYIDADYNIQIYSKEQVGDDNILQLLNASVSKGLNNERILLKLYAFDILNQNRGFSRSISNTSIQQSITNSIQQYYMLSLVYKLNEFNSGKDSARIIRH